MTSRAEKQAQASRVRAASARGSEHRAQACAALREGRLKRLREIEQVVKAYEKRVDALRATRIDEVPAAGAVMGGGAGGGGSEDRAAAAADGGASAPPPSSHAVQAELHAVEKGLKEVESAAAFELEQALWRGGLRGEALQQRLQAELAALRDAATTEAAARTARVETQPRNPAIHVFKNF